MSWRSAEKYTGAFETGHASMSISLESMFFLCSTRGGAGGRNEPAKGHRYPKTHHLLGPGPGQQRAVHRGDADGGHHEPDAALERDPLDAGILHELDCQNVSRDAAREGGQGREPH